MTRSTLRLAMPAAAGAAVLLLLSACGGSSGGTATAATGSPGTTTEVRTGHTPAGTVLVDSRGRTMYAFAADAKGRSRCTASCLTYWPLVPVGAQPPALGSGVTARLGVLHRPGGGDQLTVDGWPMYTYVGDTAAGTDAGQGKNLSGGKWWVVDPAGRWVKKAATVGGGKAGY